MDLKEIVSIIGLELILLRLRNFRVPNPMELVNDIYAIYLKRAMKAIKKDIRNR